MKAITIKSGLLNTNSVFSNDRSTQVFNLITTMEIDIMALTETKVTQGSAALLNCSPPSHEIFHTARGQGGGGVAFIISKKLKAKKFKHSLRFFSFELLIVEFRSHEGNCLLINIYRPPNRSQSSFLNEFETLLESLNPVLHDIVIMGDFNFHVNEPNDIYGTKLTDLLTDNAYANRIHVPTFQSGNTLDLVIDSYIKPSVMITEVSTDLSFSDHALVLFNLLRTPYYARVEKSITFRKYEDHRAFQDCVLADLERSKTPNSSQFTARMNAALGTYCEILFPLITKAILHSGSSPWYTGHCKIAKAKCRKTERQYRKHKTSENRQRYLTALRDSAKTIKRAKSDYYCKFFKDTRTSPRKLHAAVSYILGKVTEKPLPRLADSAPQELSIEMSSYLYEKIAGLKAELATLPTSPLVLPLENFTARFDSFNSIGESSFDDIYRKCRITYCDLDPIDFRKISPIFLKQHFMRVINTTFATSAFPESEKRGLIHPLLKSFDLDIDDLKSYRPITNITYIAKLIETAMYFQLSKFVFDNDLLPANQSAYRPGYSTESALVRIHSDIIRSLDIGQHTIAVYLDMSSAFDSVDHELLLRELSSIGIRGSALELIRSYLTDRVVQVSIRSHRSEPRNLEFGVPQGSVLGPLLFSLYTRKLSSLLTSLGFPHHIYADDAQFYISFNDGEVHLVREKITEALKQIKNLMTTLRLKLNLSKTKFMIFSPKNKRHISENFGHIQFDGKDVYPSSEVKSLGITFDSQLTFRKQIDNVIKSCNFSLYNLQVARDHLPRDVLINTVTQEVLSRLDYCNSLYLCLPKYQLFRLQKIINRCARLIYRLPKRAPISQYLRSLHFLPIGQRIDNKIITLSHAAVTTGKPGYLHELFTESIRGNIVHPAAPSGHKFVERAFFFSAPRLYSKLPSELRGCINMTVFKKRVKTLLFDDAYDHKLDSLLHYEPNSEFIMTR